MTLRLEYQSSEEGSWSIPTSIRFTRGWFICLSKRSTQAMCGPQSPNEFAGQEKGKSPNERSDKGREGVDKGG